MMRSAKKATSSFAFEDHLAFTDFARRGVLIELRNKIMILDDRLEETITRHQRIAYKLIGDKIFLEIKVQRAAIVLHVIDVSISESDAIVDTIPDSHGWGDLKKRIWIRTTQDANQAFPFIEGAYQYRAARVR
jgi:predicted transport protein